MRGRQDVHSSPHVRRRQHREHVCHVHALGLGLPRYRRLGACARAPGERVRRTSSYGNAHTSLTAGRGWQGKASYGGYLTWDDHPVLAKKPKNKVGCCCPVGTWRCTLLHSSWHAGVTAVESNSTTNLRDVLPLRSLSSSCVLTLSLCVSASLCLCSPFSSRRALSRIFLFTTDLQDR